MYKFKVASGAFLLFEDGKVELAQLAFQFFFFAVAVLVAQGVELRGVVHVGEVGQFVADDVAHEGLGQEHEVTGELDDLFGGAVAQFAHAASDFEASGFEAQFVRDALGQG